MTEAQHQTMVFKWTQQPNIRAAFPELKLLFHIPNGGKRSPIEAKHLKQQGVKSGVPDLLLPVPRNGYHALYIEMKTDKGVVSQNQKWWIEELKKQGNQCFVCRGWEEAVECLKNYLSKT